MPILGTLFSASSGTTLEEAAAGVPHGMIRYATAAQIRASGGSIVEAPEMDRSAGIMNQQHVHVVEAAAVTVFSEPLPNPVPKQMRIGGPEYKNPGQPPQGAMS